jgi:hypothetical protein
MKEPTFTCATCNVVIAHHPTFHVGLAFCCAGCAADGPCGCSYDLDEPLPAAASVAVRAETVITTSVTVEPVPVAASARNPAAPARVPGRAPAPVASGAAALAVARR